MAKKAKPRVLILSDMWGKQRMDWLQHYTDALKPHFKVDFKDCSELAEIDLPIFVEDALHYEYVRWGIDIAVKNLSKETQEYAAIIGVSMGGTIGWKALLRGRKTRHFIGISATRLRYETKKPDCNIKLYYGADDEFKPDDAWKERLGIQMTVFEGKGHHVYYESLLARLVCRQVADE